MPKEGKIAKKAFFVEQLKGLTIGGSDHCVGAEVRRAWLPAQHLISMRYRRFGSLFVVVEAILRRS